MSRPTARRQEQPYRLMWRDDPALGLGYHVYRELGSIAGHLLAPLLTLADKSQWRRISDRAFAHEAEAWAWLVDYCWWRNDWHGVGYARSMLALTDPQPRDPWLVHFANEPAWVRELYRVES